MVRRPHWLANAAALMGAATLVLASGPMVGRAAAQQPRDRLVVTPEWLATHLHDPNLVLLHVGQRDDYEAEHIPGARYIDMHSIAAPEDHDAGTGLSLQMPEPGAAVDTLESLGISDDSRIVVYYGTNWVTPAARILYTLDWIGLGDRTSLLDGGMQQWKTQGHPTTAEPTPPATPGTMMPRVRRDLIVTAEWVRDHLHDDRVRIIDARAPVYYDGIQPTYLHRAPVRKGHIAGAANVPYTAIADDALRIKSAEELAAIFQKAGVQRGDTVVGYCHLGQQATLMLFGARTLGIPIKLYDGSFQEWGSRNELPVELPGGEQ